MTFRAAASSGAVASNATRAIADAFGTFEQLDAVLFNYLTQLGSLGKPFVDYILQGSSAPPTARSPLLASTSSFPILEAQLWGRLPFSDIDYIMSDIAVDGREPIFGRSIGSALRSWAHLSSGPKPIRWAAAADSTAYAVDAAGDSRFQQFWDGSANSSEQDILNALQVAGFMTQ